MRRFDVKRLDDVIHGRVRLGIMAYLGKTEVAEFRELRSLLDTTAGNLSVHLSKLEEARYVVIEKAFLSRKPITRVRITRSGQAAFRGYLDEVSSLVESHKQARTRKAAS